MKLFASSSHWPIFLTGNFNSLLNLFLPLILVRLYGPQEMGIYKIFFLYVSLIPFFTMTAGFLTSVYYWVGDKRHLSENTNAVWQITLTLSLLNIVPVFLVVSLLLQDSDFSFGEIALITFSSILAAPSALYGEYCMAIGRTSRSLLLATSFEIIKISGFIFLSYYYRDIKLILFFFLLMMIGSFLTMNTLAWRDQLFNIKFNLQAAKRVFDYSFPISLSAALVVIIDKADQLLLATFLSTTDYAYYTLGCLVVPTILILEASIQKKLIPRLSQSYQNKQLREMTRELKQAIESIAFLTIPSIFGLVLYADVVVELLYTDEYREASVFLRVFALSYALYLIPFDSLLRASGQSKLLLKINIYFAVISLLIIFIFAYFTSALYTLVISIIIKFIYRLFIFNKSCQLTGISCLTIFQSKKITEYILLCSFLTAVCYGTNGLYPNQLLAFSINASLFAIIYLFFFLKIRK